MLSQTLRHRVDLQALSVTQDEDTGAAIEEWDSVLGSSEDLLAAEVRPLSGREFLAAASTQAAVNTKITIRYRPDVRPSMRVMHEGTIYNVRAVLPDPTLRTHLTLMCESGANEG